MSLRWKVLCLALGLATIAGVPSAMAGGHTDCERFYASSVPLIHPAYDVVEVELCDEDGDGVHDTASFETRHVPSEGSVSVTNEEKQRAYHQDEETRANVFLDPGTPGRPAAEQTVRVDDDGNDGQVDSVQAEGRYYTTLDSGYLYFDATDPDGDAVPNGYGLLVCTPGNVCSAPGPRMVPDVPDRIDLPDTVVELPILGHVP